MLETWEGEGIRYWDLAAKIFPATQIQEIIPFAGAGVSVSARASAPPPTPPSYPSAEVMIRLYDLLGITDEDARLYLEFAVRSAFWMQARGKGSITASREKFLQQLREAPYPPFAWELSEMFSQLVPYRMLEDTGLPALRRLGLVSEERAASAAKELVPMLRLLSEVTGVGSPTDALTSIASLYEAGSDRSDLWQNLYTVFENKRTPTETHRLIARAAQAHLAHNPFEDYLAITTNYDCLIEAAMDELKVPYAVLRMNRKDGLIYCRFANLEPADIAQLQALNKPVEPANFTLRKGGRILAIVYKIHGDLYPALTKEDDGLVVTDGDYVDFISRSGRIIPAHVGSILPSKRLLFLGYSFADWNIRSIYETITSRTKERDYAVTRGISRFESTYFSKRNIVVILSGLNEFTAGITAQRGAGA